MKVTPMKCYWTYFSKSSRWKSALYFLKGFWSSLEFFCPFLDKQGKAVRCWIIISCKWPCWIWYSQDRSTCPCLKFSSCLWTLWLYYWIMLNELFTVNHRSHLQNWQVIVSWGKVANSNWHEASVSGSQGGEAGIVLDQEAQTPGSSPSILTAVDTLPGRPSIVTSCILFLSGLNFLLPGW